MRFECEIPFAVRGCRLCTAAAPFPRRRPSRDSWCRSPSAEEVHQVQLPRPATGQRRLWLEPPTRRHLQANHQLFRWFQYINIISLLTVEATVKNVMKCGMSYKHLTSSDWLLRFSFIANSFAVFLLTFQLKRRYWTIIARRTYCPHGLYHLPYWSGVSSWTEAELLQS